MTSLDPNLAATRVSATLRQITSEVYQGQCRSALGDGGTATPFKCAL